jgi:septal ring factor EnvC (AmiA/AmiB activator)
MILRNYIVAVLLLLPASASSGPLEENRSKQKELLDRYEDHRQLIYDGKEQQKIAKGDIVKLQEQRRELNARLISTASLVQKTEEDLGKTEKRLQELAGLEKEHRADLLHHYEKMEQLLGVMQRISRQPPPIMVTGRKDALHMFRSVMLSASVFPLFRKQADAMAEKLTRLATVQNEQKLQVASLQEQGRMLTASKIRIEDALEEKRKLVTLRQEELAVLQEKIKQHAKTAANTRELLEKINREVEVGTRLARYKAEIRSRNITEIAPKGREEFIQSLARMQPSRPFYRNRGKLPLPVRGQIVSGYGEKIDASDKRTRGITIMTRGNAQVISPSDGWIVYADKFRSYGKLLIIDTGGGYHILLAGVERIDVSVGQFVLAGEPIAVMGEGTGMQLPKLYVEFRKGRNPADPGPWWSRKYADARS